MNTEYHVSISSGSDLNDGSRTAPFRTISKAAETAELGDRVVVHEGVYREWVKPAHSGHSSTTRIVYEAAEGEKAVIKGSEVIDDWSRNSDGVWQTTVSNDMFGDYNPYSVRIDGDWFVRPEEYPLHTGQVYFDGKGYLEAHSYEHLLETAETWYAIVDEAENTTAIYANFGDNDPCSATVEINVRRSCFYPEKTGINYITVRGFEIAHGATPWAPPTADQPGIIGANWSKGWIIENNIIHDARCSAVSLGKEASTGHNLYTKRHRKPGYQYQFESVMRALHIGWSKERIGSHIVRNNRIYNCGQNGVVGHMGCAFSEVYGNHIYNIGNLEEFFGHEIAGIKLHAAIDVQVYDNLIHDCRLAMWFDWQAQGMRISRNICYRNMRDLWMEVSHGPFVVDNNIFGSENALANAAQGGAYVHNLFCGGIYHYSVLNRSTPYHVPHSTEVAGTALVYSFDDRVYQNIYARNYEAENGKWRSGTYTYDGCPVSLDEYIERVLENGKGDVETYDGVKQPAYINNNCYLDGAKSFDREESKYSSSADPNVKIYEQGGAVYLEIDIPEDYTALPAEIITTEKLDMPRIVEAPYENPDESLIAVNIDLLGNARCDKPTVGPVESLKPGHNKICIWGSKK